MATLDQIVYSILDTVKPDNMTNSQITPELVRFHVKNVRAQLAKQTIGKYGVLPNQYFQPLGCVSLILADKSECCEFPTGCTILRSEIPIPNTIDGSTNLLRVGPVDVTAEPFQPIEFERVPFEGYNRFTKHLTKWFINNNTNYVYLLVNTEDYLLSSLETVSMQGAIEDPEVASNFVNCTTGGVCFSPDSKYPIPDSILPILQEMVIKKFVSMQAQQPIDSSNDNKQNPETIISKGN